MTRSRRTRRTRTAHSTQAGHPGHRAASRPAIPPHAESWAGRPFWQDELVTIYQGDALDILPALPTASASAVITDPPYMINALSAIGTAAKTGTWAGLMNATRWYATWYTECARILRADGSLWTCCSWRTLPVVLKAATDAGLPVTSAVVWDKDAITVGGPRSLRGTYEMCAVLAKPEFRIRNRSIPDVWRIKTSTRKPHGHPAEKPEALIGAILAVLDLPPGSRILDPFLGSGTVAAAARAAGLACTGIEAEDRWCQAAARRLAAQAPPAACA
jgi:DNA modification methylase